MSRESSRRSESVAFGAEDPAGLRKAYSLIPSAVAVLAASVDDTKVGMTVATLLPVSLHPPLLGAMIQSTSRTWSELASNGRLGVSILSTDQSLIARRLAAADRESRFDGIITDDPAGDGCLRIVDASTWFGVRVASESDAGDHIFVLLEVDSGSSGETIDPLIFHRSVFRAVADQHDPNSTWPLADIWQ